MLAGVELARRRRTNNFSNDRGCGGRYRLKANEREQTQQQQREAVCASSPNSRPAVKKQPCFSRSFFGDDSSRRKEAVADSTRRKEALAARQRLEGRLRAMELRSSSVSAATRDAYALKRSSSSSSSKSKSSILSNSSMSQAAAAAPTSAAQAQAEAHGKHKPGRDGDKIALVVKSSSQDCAAGRECPVCLETFTRGQVLLRLPCSHEFHGECVTRWLLGNGRCPYCRCPVHYSVNANHG